MLSIYLDVCCLNRPFDDQTQERICLETQAVLLILERCQSLDWQMVGSEVVDFEISRIPDDERRLKVKLLASLAKSKVTISEQTERRAREFTEMGFKALDALHLSCAEEAKVEVLLTTDDGFLRKARKHANLLNVKVRNPNSWLMKVIRDENSEDTPNSD